jgi:hypothetical protein
MTKQEFEILKNNLVLFADLININDTEEDILSTVSELIKYTPKQEDL